MFVDLEGLTVGGFAKPVFANIVDKYHKILHWELRVFETNAARCGDLLNTGEFAICHFVNLRHCFVFSAAALEVDDSQVLCVFYLERLEGDWEGGWD